MRLWNYLFIDLGGTVIIPLTIWPKVFALRPAVGEFPECPFTMLPEVTSQPPQLQHQRESTLIASWTLEHHHGC
jgi:hypothetical protein